jgi:hypothetical protein
LQAFVCAEESTDGYEAFHGGACPDHAAEDKLGEKIEEFPHILNWPGHQEECCSSELE